MASATVRISEKTRKSLRELASKSGESMQTILDRAVEQYRRQRILEEGNAAYARLREDPVAWAAWQQELAAWDATLMDGLDPDEIWTEDGYVIRRSESKVASG